MKCVLAFDKFRGSLSATQVIDAVKEGLLEAAPHLSIVSFPLADGGEGSLEILANAYHCSLRDITTMNAVLQRVDTQVAFNDKTRVAIIEMARHAGLANLPPEARDPMKTSTYGVGEAINQVLDWGAQQIIIGIGGSATNDGGAGMLKALGYQFLTHDHEAVTPRGGNLSTIQHIIPPDKSFASVKITLASDVMNPLVGPEGATYTYAPQKGAADDQLPELEKNLIHLAEKIRQLTGHHAIDIPGYGAAGGFPLCACEMLDAQIKSGSDIIFDIYRMADHIQTADVVITGEGKIDQQTSFGKAISPIIHTSTKYQKELWLVCGVFSSKELDGYNRIELKKVAQALNRDSFKDAFVLAKEAGRRIATSLNPKGS